MYAFQSCIYVNRPPLATFVPVIALSDVVNIYEEYFTDDRQLSQNHFFGFEVPQMKRSTPYFMHVFKTMMTTKIFAFKQKGKSNKCFPTVLYYIPDLFYTLYLNVYVLYKHSEYFILNT